MPSSCRVRPVLSHRPPRTHRSASPATTRDQACAAASIVQDVTHPARAGRARAPGAAALGVAASSRSTAAVTTCAATVGPRVASTQRIKPPSRGPRGVVGFERARPTTEVWRGRSLGSRYRGTGANGSFVWRSSDEGRWLGGHRGRGRRGAGGLWILLRSRGRRPQGGASNRQSRRGGRVAFLAPARAARARARLACERCDPVRSGHRAGFRRDGRRSVAPSHVSTTPANVGSSGDR
jgi:hypothetical protein